MKRIVIAFIECLLCFCLNGQAVKPVGIGDKVPDVMLTIIEKDSVRQVSLKSLYQQQHLIIDFWATWCTSCIRGIAGADSVLKEFNNEVMVLPVTYEDIVTVKRFTAKNKVLSNLKLLYGVNDTILMGKAIPFRVLPHEVWINKDGIIKAITYPDEVTKDNITAFVNDEQLNVEGKVDEMEFDFGKPLAFRNNKFMYRSILGPYKEGVSSFTVSSPNAVAYQSGTRLNRFMMTNTSVLGLYYAAYSQSRENIKISRVDMHVRDPKAVNPYLDKNVNRKWKWEHLYCYELILPGAVAKDELFAAVFEELNRCLAYRGTVESRLTDCFVLVNTDPGKNPCSKGDKPRLSWEAGVLKKLVNKKMDMLTEYLNWNMEMPVVDESGITEAIDMEIEVHPILKEGEVVFELEPLRKSLMQYGLDLVKKKRVVPFLMIRDK